MKKLHTFDFLQRPLAGMYQELFAQEGIPCLLRNDLLSSAVGEIPFIECCPELWVIDDEIYPRARLLLDNCLAEHESDRINWTCSSCGETSEGQFCCCWNCGHQRD